MAPFQLSYVYINPNPQPTPLEPDYPQSNYFTLVALEDNSTVLFDKIFEQYPYYSFEYRINSQNDEDWKTYYYKNGEVDEENYIFPSTITLENIGDFIQFRGFPQEGFNTGSQIDFKFFLTGLFKCKFIDSLNKDSGNEYTYEYIFENCSSLKKVNINIDDDRNNAFYYSFENCSQLIEAEIIINNEDWFDIQTWEMFSNCFLNCSKLSLITCNFMNWYDKDNDVITPNWVYGVSSTGVFYCPSALVPDREDQSYYNVNQVPPGWTVKWLEQT